jgi:AcrR family transcriptional regulator
MMNAEPAAPTGLARRGRRLPDQETERRMLRAAVAMVHRSGLTVSLEHISFEDVIRDADVSRSSVYRRWPYKDLFFSDLVMELAKDATPAIAGGEVELIKAIAAAHPDWLDTPELRRSLLVETFRQLALFDFQALYGSADWRTYIALHATFMSLTDGGLRDQVQAVLAQSEQGRIARISGAWKHLAGLFGYRLRPGLDATFDTVATLIDATMRGLVIMALSMPDIAEHRLQASPFGTARVDEWSLPAVGLAGIATTFLEPDPEVEWDDERLTTVRHALADLTLPDA